jgi:hypothetical protein
MPTSRINDLIHDRYKEPKLTTLQKVAEAIGCSVGDFLEETAPRQGERKESETAPQREAYTPGTNSTVPGGPSHVGLDPAAALRVAFSSADPPLTLAETGRALQSAVPQLADLGVLLARVGAALIAAEAASAGALEPGQSGTGDSNGGSSPGGPLPPASGGSAR